MKLAVTNEQMKTAECEDPRFTSSHVDSKITTIYRATSGENNLKTSRKDSVQPKT